MPRNRNLLMFVDDSGFNLNLRRSKARSKRGKKAPVVIPAVRGRNMTLIIAANCEEVIYQKVISDSTCNSDVFKLFLQELFAIIESRNDLHNSWVVMDNARIHKVEAVQNVCNQFGCSLQFLSPYSYMLNPVENAFSKIKNVVRNRLSATNPSERLDEIIYSGTLSITREDLNGYFEHMISNICMAEIGHIFN